MKIKYHEAFKIAKERGCVVRPLGWKYGVKFINEYGGIYVYGDNSTTLFYMGKPKQAILCDKIMNIEEWEILDNYSEIDYDSATNAPIIKKNLLELLNNIIRVDLLIAIYVEYITKDGVKKEIVAININ